MMYLLAILLPPVAVLMVGKPFQALLNLGLCILLWIPGVIHACLVVADSKADKRMKKQVKMQAKYNKKS
ncbi:YqaE/Pmp3 family membrane protein [Aquibacillus saliphilus]|uniref:YqaE/Pmp3 family membrane protein n=1 Tax=Aquibacillus saliphilus TaxID=1909422 RepID=UPI001CEFB535|nr:YqaE/Pmp3 family membrane protein [Aquibacillus saliphilus]